MTGIILRNVKATRPLGVWIHRKRQLLIVTFFSPPTQSIFFNDKLIPLEWNLNRQVFLQKKRGINSVIGEKKEAEIIHSRLRGPSFRVEVIRGDKWLL